MPITWYCNHYCQYYSHHLLVIGQSQAKDRSAIVSQVMKLKLATQLPRASGSQSRLKLLRQREDRKESTYVNFQEAVK